MQDLEITNEQGHKTQANICNTVENVPKYIQLYDFSKLWIVSHERDEHNLIVMKMVLKPCWLSKDQNLKWSSHIIIIIIILILGHVYEELYSKIINIIPHCYYPTIAIFLFTK